MSRKNTNARRLKRNKRVRNARRAAKSKWKWVIPLMVIITFAALAYYKMNLANDYTATATLYDKVNNVHIVTEECVTGASENAARIRTTFIKNAVSNSSTEVKDVVIIKGCNQNLKSMRNTLE